MLFRSRFNPKYDRQPGSSIEGVVFRNITYTGVGENRSLIQGLSRDGMVRNVTFENVTINGEKMRDLKETVTNEFISNVSVK